MTISIVAIQEERGTKPVTRSRVDRATACYYPDSKRVVVVADRADFAAAEQAIRELRDHISPAEYVQTCVDCNHTERADDVVTM
ncbi:hypothetical protein I5G58_gp075 [Mycobacterium phage BirdsNest]|uniref:Uncharacterized protein n=1 Tax=Mycobacterium phage BirdsNest TaxID=2686231 RepID=A0A6B9L6Q7_9CAUD|nr:hypothetical protein I5G58_gp075 [Mycobacterium phage BirdsNest]QHB37377.1 hypothetical protein PBI_BIRDSNEST_75 [Mycobacterium phage BirdsNest]